MPKRRGRSLIVEMPKGSISQDGQSIEFNLTSETGEKFEFKASSDAIDVMMNNLEQLAIEALRRRMDLGSDRKDAPKELPALRSISSGFRVEESEPGDNFDGYRLLIFRMSRPPIMVLLQRAKFLELVEALRETPPDLSQTQKH